MTTVFHTNKPTTKWKGKTFQQISYSLKYNNEFNITDDKQLFRARPMKIYRKEISSKEASCNPRISLKIDELQRPGGSHISNHGKGLVNTLEIHHPNNTCENPTSDNKHCIVDFSVANNALRRIRSSGMTQSKFNINSKKNYFSSTSQYLDNRNLSYRNNSYFQIREGDKTSTPGTAQAISNVYSTTINNRCPVFNIQAPLTVSYKWVDATTNTVTFPVGKYDLSDINNMIHGAMDASYHYFIENPHKTRYYLLEFVNDANSNVISLVYRFARESTLNIPGGDYSYPVAPTPLAWTTVIASLNDFVSKNATITINEELGGIVGFIPDTYPATVNEEDDSKKFKTIEGTLPPVFDNKFYPIYYKPSNHQFATQGAVSSGDLIVRKKYDTITSAGATFRSAFGNHTANAVAYGVPSYGYTIKDKIGYPVKKTPVFSKYSNIMMQCPVRTFVNII